MILPLSVRAIFLAMVLLVAASCSNQGPEQVHFEAVKRILHPNNDIIHVLCELFKVHADRDVFFNQVGELSPAENTMHKKMADQFLAILEIEKSDATAQFRKLAKELIFAHEGCAEAILLSAWMHRNGHKDWPDTKEIVRLYHEAQAETRELSVSALAGSRIDLEESARRLIYHEGQYYTHEQFRNTIGHAAIVTVGELAFEAAIGDRLKILGGGFKHLTGYLNDRRSKPMKDAFQLAFTEEVTAGGLGKFYFHEESKLWVTRDKSGHAPWKAYKTHDNHLVHVAELNENGIPINKHKSSKFAKIPLNSLIINNN